MSEIKDTDYLFLSTRVRTLERNMLTRDKMERMLEARSEEDAIRVLAECGYPEPTEELNMDTVGALIAQERNQVFADLYSYAPDRRSSMSFGSNMTTTMPRFFSKPRPPKRRRSICWSLWDAWTRGN